MAQARRDLDGLGANYGKAERRTTAAARSDYGKVARPDRIRRATTPSGASSWVSAYTRWSRYEPATSR